MHAVCTTLLIETSPQALPLGAACIASSIKNHSLTKDIFNTVELIAISKEEEGFCKAEKTHTTAEYIAEKLCKNGVPEFACFSVYVWNRNYLEEAALCLKKKNPSVVTIAGGPEVTANPESFSNFDYTIAGAGELAIPELISLIINDKKAEIPGVYQKILKNHNVPEAPQKSSVCRATVPDLSKISSPYLDGTLDVKDYGGALWELARGCPFKCSYCYESKGEKKIQYFPMERIEKELELFNKNKISQVFVLDPTYNANKKRALDLLNLIAKKAPGMFFYFEARAEFIDRELARAFTKIPCALQFGLQSADPEVLKLVHRTLDKKLFTRNIGYLNETGAIFGFDLIYGLPGDTLEGFKKSIDFALNLYPNNLETFCLSVLPGTDLADTADSLGLIYEKTAPYHVLKTDKYSEKDLANAEKISHACNIFYNNGRSVPWFNSVCHALHQRPSLFLEDFAFWYEKNIQPKNALTLADFDYTNGNAHEKIEELQIAFVKEHFTKRGRQNLLKVTENLIRFNGALSRVESDRKEQTVQLDYHPDDLASQYATDIQFFSKNCRPFKNKTRCFKNKNGQTDWRL